VGPEGLRDGWSPTGMVKTNPAILSDYDLSKWKRRGFTGLTFEIVAANHFGSKPT
jgi:hypothetical protein